MCINISLVFYRLKYPAAQHLEGHQEFTKKSLPADAKFVALKDKPH